MDESATPTVDSRPGASGVIMKSVWLSAIISNQMNKLSLPAGIESDLLLAVEGGGTRSQAALLDAAGHARGMAESADVNVHFTAPERARDAVYAAVEGALKAASVSADAVTRVAWAAGPPELAR